MAGPWQGQLGLILDVILVHVTGPPLREGLSNLKPH